MAYLKFQIVNERICDLEKLVDGFQPGSGKSGYRPDVKLRQMETGNQVSIYLISGDSISIKKIQAELLSWGNNDCLFLRI